MLAVITTRHSAAGEFATTLAEVLAQLPENPRTQVVAIELDPDGVARHGDVVEATATLYGQA